MAVVLAQVGTTLRLVDPDTGISELLTLPDGVTIDASKVMSVAALDLGAAIVWAPSRNLLLTADRELVLLNPTKPVSLSAAAGGAGVLTGAYKYAFSFIRKDADGNVITESAMSALSSVTLSSQQGALTSIDVSTDTDTVTGRRLYRTLSGGTILFHLADIDDNSTTTYNDNAADATLSILPEESHREDEIPGTNASDTYKLRLIVSWKNRLWAVSNAPRELDIIKYTEDGLAYRWGNELTANPKGVELNGIVGFIPRKDELGVGKRGGLWSIAGDSDLSFRITQIGINKGGMISQRGAVVINDEAFYHGPDGVNQWNAGGIDSLTDSTVRPWFMSDRYFNRERFSHSFAKWNEVRNAYDLHLCRVGETTSDVWVSYSRNTKAWFGPHRTAAADYTCAAKVENTDGIGRVLVADADGHINTLDPDEFHDAASTAITFEVVTPDYNCDTPNVEKEFGELDVKTRRESMAGTMAVVATLTPVEADEAAATATMGVDLTQGRERCGRVGRGASCQLTFTQDSVDQPCVLQGFELPFFERGRRG